ncbi:Zn-dependent exopeptidase [Cylindrobasidium torrendii FP15055 ss-10]|uniref:Zn-dependent exopeptidase n=1 Tax=Cylindrobasidium torrendii FP15055 ss-10 TaxID=1314674 RepID=A0A0D7BPY7_9AGAR|nr:Zn-dependent exopeptidase [Cylindrobasidium torrendii FP15055 ss-10]
MGDKKGSHAIPPPATSPLPRQRHPFLKSALVALSIFAGVHFLKSSLTSRSITQKPPLIGKTAEDLFLTVPSEASCTETSRQFTSKPHPAGSDNDKTTALDYLHLIQKELGISPPLEEPIFAAGSPHSRHATLSIPHTSVAKAWIDEYYPVMNTPLERAVQVLDDDGNVLFDFDLTEHTDDTDPEAGKYYDAVPTFHGLSQAGDVTGKLIYANYGRKEDYDALVAQGVNTTGAIILARYGANFRGLKIKAAQEVGAAGVLIYSDTRDDGDVTVENGYEAYPNGPARSPTSVQRGSVQFISLYPGDPTTPGYPAYENSTRTEGLNRPSIPSLPLSSANAAQLLKLADGKNLVRLKNDVDTKVIPIWNTIAVIPGSIKDEVVLVGNHRDAWVMGASDPTSGTASLAETIRGLGALVKEGWKPLRTIVIASWDAEEYGLIGSTEWGEDFPEFIRDNVVAYFNLDGSAGGSRWSAHASPSLAHFIEQTALEIPHPTDAARTLWDARTDSGPFAGNGTFTEVQAESVAVGALGSGSDYTVFLQHIGVASADSSFSSGPGDAVYHYHSVYDSEYWMEKYGDPGFYRHVAVAKHLGLQILRMSSNTILPFNTTYYSLELEKYLDRVESLATTQAVFVDLSALRQSIHTLRAASLALDYEKFAAEKALLEIIQKWRQREDVIKKRFKKVYCSIKKLLGSPCDEVVQQQLLLGRVEIDSLYGLALHAAGLKAAGCQNSFLPGLPLSDLKKALQRIRAVNKKLSTFEHGFISEEGIPDREWYKHLGVAPGKWLGYGATTLPALTEAITIEGNAEHAAYEAERLRGLVEALAERLRA